jgi:hypothetical protein
MAPAFGAKESGMSTPSPVPGPSASTRGAGRPLTVVELTIVLEELDRVVAELEAALLEVAMPLDEPSRCAMRDAIAAARRH